MLDTIRIGANISKLRKKAELTQMELAERMNVSFQAVSNWERGQSMPDITRLGQLSEVLYATLDEILGNEKATKILEGLDDPEAPVVEIEDVASIAPLLKTEQTDRLIGAHEGLAPSELSGIAPFISAELLGQIANTDMEKHQDFSRLTPLLPFLNDENLDGLVRDWADTGLHPNVLLPFLSKESIAAIVEAKYKERQQLGDIASYAPFMSDDSLAYYAQDALERSGDLSSIACVAPFLRGDSLNELARKELSEHGIKALSPIMPFIDKKILEDYIVEHMAKNIQQD